MSLPGANFNNLGGGSTKIRSVCSTSLRPISFVSSEFDLSSLSSHRGIISFLFPLVGHAAKSWRKIHQDWVLWQGTPIRDVFELLSIWRYGSI